MTNRKRMLCAALAAVTLLAGCKPYEPQPHIEHIPYQSDAAQTNEASTTEEQEDVLPLMAATYPEISPYPLEQDYYNEYNMFENDAYFEVYDKYRDDIRALRADSAYLEQISYDFFSDSMQVYLSGAEGENVAFSPVNLYVALSMVAETAGGSSRQQILSALGEENMESLRLQANAVWRQFYNTSPLCTQHIASSLWLSDGFEYNEQTLSTLAENYYASTYSGKMGSEAYNKAYQDWLNEQTGGLLSGYVQDKSFSEDMLMCLASTMYYNAQWVTKFSENCIEQDVFHAPNGDVQAEYLKCTYDNKYVYCAENYFALTESLEGGGTMYFVMPDEDITVEQLVCDEELYRMLEDSESAEQRKLKVYLSVPKFDISSRCDLKDGMRQIGITDIFEGETADFSPLADIDGNIWIDKADHAVRVSMDENGCTAASYIDMMYCGDALPEDVEELYLTFDRPFMFVIQQNGFPLFCGVVNQP